MADDRLSRFKNLEKGRREDVAALHGTLDVAQDRALAAAVEQLSVSISHVADHAREAAASSEEARSRSNEGRNVVERAIVDLKALANEAVAAAAVTQAQATLSTDETNLSKASIRSPIDGVILTRAVEPGNAVAASLQAVTLFTMAPDLSKLLLSVNVDEADVGQVQVGQKARFTVSAWPGRQYPAQITRVAYGSTITDNVVTYTTQLQVANPDLTLRPGMTATATIAATEKIGVLLVPNTALNFQPSVPGAGAAPPSSGGGGIVSSLMPRPPGGNAPRKTGTTARGGAERQLWVLQDGRPVAIAVKTGLSNGRQTEVSGEGLREGLAVVTEQRSGAAAR